MNSITQGLSWQFLNEPLWAWFVFFIAMTLFMSAWGVVLYHMKSAV